MLELVLPDVIVCDLGRPGEAEADGEDFIRRLRRWPLSRGGRIPVLAFTGYVTPEDRNRALAAGFDAFLPKPASPPELFGAILALLREAAARPTKA